MGSSNLWPVGEEPTIHADLDPGRSQSSRSIFIERLLPGHRAGLCSHPFAQRLRFQNVNGCSKSKHDEARVFFGIKGDFDLEAIVWIGPGDASCREPILDSLRDR